MLKQAFADFQFSRSHASQVVRKSGLMKPVVGNDSGSFIFTKSGSLAQLQLTILVSEGPVVSIYSFVFSKTVSDHRKSFLECRLTTGLSTKTITFALLELKIAVTITCFAAPCISWTVLMSVSECISCLFPTLNPGL